MNIINIINIKNIKESIILFFKNNCKLKSNNIYYIFKASAL